MPRTGPSTNPNPGVTQSAAPDLSAAPLPGSYWGGDPNKRDEVESEYRAKYKDPIQE